MPEDGLKSNGKPYTVLIVHPSFSERRKITQYLKSRLYEICAELDNGNQAEAMFKAKNPDLVILNYDLPGKNGLESMKDILSHNPLAKVIIISENKYAFAEKDALAIGAKRFLITPLDRNDFLETVHSVMSNG